MSPHSYRLCVIRLLCVTPRIDLPLSKVTVQYAHVHTVEARCALHKASSLNLKHGAAGQAIQRGSWRSGCRKKDNLGLRGLEKILP